MLPISAFCRPIYTYGIGLYTGQYFNIDNRLLVLPIVACDICSANISISEITLYCLILWILDIGICRVSANIRQYFTIILVSLIRGLLNPQKPRYIFWVNGWDLRLDFADFSVRKHSRVWKWSNSITESTKTKYLPKRKEAKRKFPKRKVRVKDIDCIWQLNENGHPNLQCGIRINFV